MSIRAFISATGKPQVLLPHTLCDQHMLPGRGCLYTGAYIHTCIYKYINIFTPQQHPRWPLQCLHYAQPRPAGALKWKNVEISEHHFSRSTRMQEKGLRDWQRHDIIQQRKCARPASLGSPCSVAGPSRPFKHKKRVQRGLQN